MPASRCWRLPADRFVITDCSQMYPSAHQQKTPLMRGFLLVPGAAFQIVSRGGYPNDPKHRSQLGEQGVGLRGARRQLFESTAPRRAPSWCTLLDSIQELSDTFTARRVTTDALHLVSSRMWETSQMP
ncbi:hypothetical protein XFF6992_140002 [Xanthomonas citri pv. fuscans]|nr:hypothetical protein XFF6992_140002 [Xanthomonas citri pv. fuscans]SOO34102.1 hypothetical protein XFF6994_3530004 [Xanthomonas citri pv. fuscans]